MQGEEDAEFPGFFALLEKNARAEHFPQYGPCNRTATLWYNRSLDRPHLTIYAALQVPEIWRYDSETFQVLILGSNGQYRQKSKSLPFPKLPIAPFAQYVGKLDSTDEVTPIREFTGWVNRVAKVVK